MQKRPKIFLIELKFVLTTKNTTKTAILAQNFERCGKRYKIMVNLIHLFIHLVGKSWLIDSRYFRASNKTNICGIVKLQLPKYFGGEFIDSLEPLALNSVVISIITFMWLDVGGPPIATLFFRS